MKAVILAGGYGTRLSEETSIRPKPMVEIGGQPILWHIMKIYSHYGINDFIICCGYKGEVIKEYFANYHIRNADVTFDLGKHNFTILKNGAEDWRVTLVDTGLGDTPKTQRLLQIRKYLDNQPFCLTYGDGVSDVDLEQLLSLHRKSGKLATVTAVRPPARVTMGKGRLLLMVDESIRDISGSILENLGYRVSLAGDGGEALQLYMEALDTGSPFDAVIMDLSVPGGMGGMEAVRRLLAIDPKARVIVSSGYSNDPIMSEYRKYGFKDVLVKPYKISELSEAVKRVLEKD